MPWRWRGGRGGARVRIDTDGGHEHESRWYNGNRNGAIGSVGNGRVVPVRLGAMANTMPAANALRKRQEGGFFAGLRAVLRLVVPVVFLLFTLAGAYLYSDSYVTLFDDNFASSQWRQMPGYWLTWGHVLLAFSFFAIHAANRRYGQAYAVAQIVVAWAIIGALVVAAQTYLGAAMTASPIPPPRLGGAFVFAAILAHLIAAVVFDRMRGIRWWEAPFFGSFWAGATFCFVFYPVAFAGTEEPWINHAIVHFAIMSAMAIVLLFPYWLIRPLVRPLPGFGGY